MELLTNWSNIQSQTYPNLIHKVTTVHKVTYKYQRVHESTQRRIWVSSTHEDFVTYAHQIIKSPFQYSQIVHSRVLEWKIWAPNTTIWACTNSYDLLSSNLNLINYVRIDVLGTVGKPYSSAACSKWSRIVRDNPPGQSPNLDGFETLQRTA